MAEQLPAGEPSISLSREVGAFDSVAGRVALGDLSIRQQFARTVTWLFVMTNVLVMLGLAFIVWLDNGQLAAGTIKAGDRIIDAKVIMTLLGATTVQLGTVIYTIARAIFPVTPAGGL